MHKLLATTVALALSAGLVAQSAPRLTSPAGYISKSGGNYAYHYGLVWWNARVQFLEQNMPAAKAAVLTRLDYRSSTRYTYTTFNRWGKTYTNVQLTLGNAASKMTSVFSTNYQSAGTQVYNAKLTLPNLSTGSVKQVWGNTCTVPHKAFVYTSKYDLLMDWTVAGGKLNNGYTGGSGFVRYNDGITGTSNNSINYLYPGSSTAPGSKYVPRSPTSGSGRCSDSGQTATFADAYAYLYARIYGDAYSTFSLRGKLYLSSLHGYYGRKSGTHIGVLSLWGSDTGVNIGAKCHKLHVRMDTRLATVAVKANTSGHSNNHLPTNTNVAYNNAWAGAVVMWQYAFEDSKTKQLGLSIATKIVLPKKPGAGAVKPGAFTYRYFYSGTWRPNNSNAAYGYNPISNAVYNPIEGWSRK